MSVILNALQSQEKDKEKAVQDSSGEGFFVGGSGSEVKTPRRKMPSLPKRIWLLLGALCVAIAFTITSFVLKNPSDVKQQTALNLPPLRTILYKNPIKLHSGKNQDVVPQKASELFYEGNFDDSLKEYQNVLTLDPDNAEIHNNTGLVLLKKGLLESSEKHFDRAIELNSGCAACFNNLGYLKTLTGEADIARRYFKKAIELEPNYTEAYFNLAVLYEKNGDIAGAVTAYQDFLKYVPDKEMEIAVKVKDRVYELTGGPL